MLFKRESSSPNPLLLTSQFSIWQQQAHAPIDVIKLHQQRRVAEQLNVADRNRANQEISRQAPDPNEDAQHGRARQPQDHDAQRISQPGAKRVQVRRLGGVKIHLTLGNLRPEIAGQHAEVNREIARAQAGHEVIDQDEGHNDDRNQKRDLNHDLQHANITPQRDGLMCGAIKRGRPLGHGAAPLFRARSSLTRSSFGRMVGLCSPKWGNIPGAARAAPGACNQRSSD